MITSYDVRAELEDLLERDLLGPWDWPDASDADLVDRDLVDADDDHEAPESQAAVGDHGRPVPRSEHRGPPLT